MRQEFGILFSGGYTFLMDLNVASKEEEMEHVAVQACEQIKEKQYLEGLQKKGYTDIIGYGIAFYKKSCLIVALT